MSDLRNEIADTIDAALDNAMGFGLGSHQLAEIATDAIFAKLDATPTREQIMADERVQALVEAGNEWLQARGETESFNSETWARLAAAESAMVAALDALTESP